MIKPSKLASAIAVASTLGAAGAVNAACPTGTTDVTGSYATALAASGRTLACQVNDASNASVTLDDTANNLYVLQGRVDFGTSYAGVDRGNAASENPATLTIEAGALVMGDDSNDAAQDPDRLVINRGSQVFMNGTLEEPILFTGRQNVETGSVERAQWGGIYLNGYGLNNGCDDAQIPAAATGACQRNGEANTGSHGGDLNSDDSGSLSYVKVAHAGDAFDPETDLNGVAFQSVGSGTECSNIQVHNNVDDGVEFYGGAVSCNNLVLTENGDDSLDSTEGWAGSAQFVVITQTGDSDQHDRAFESDNNKSPNDMSPQTTATVANVTIIRDLDTVAGGGAEPDLIKLRRGSALNLANVVISSPTDQGACFDVTDNDGHGSIPSALALDASGNSNPAAAAASIDQVFHDCFERDDAPLTVTFLDTDYSGEAVSGTVTLDGVVNGTNETAVSAATLPAGLQQVSYIGAVESCDNNWTAGWTIPGTLPANSAGDDCAPSAAVNVPVMGWAGLIALFSGLAGVATRVRRVK